MIERKHPFAMCEICSLQHKRCAKTTGPQDARVAIVSRAPGRHDVLNGKPFSGPSKKVLDHLLESNGYSRDNVLTTNVVLCETDNPPADAVMCCRPRLEAELQNAEVIIAAGVEAVQAFSRFRAVHSARGRTIKWKDKRVVATNNPALVLRDSDSFPDLVQDFKRALNPLPPPIFPTVEVINEPARAFHALSKWNSQEFSSPVASDLEWKRETTEFVCCGFAARNEKAVVLGLGAIGDERVRRELKRFYERPDVEFVWHNGKADTKILRRNGINARVGHDTFLLSYVLDEEPGRHELDYLLNVEMGWPDYEPESVREFKRTGELRKPYELYKYNGWDAAGTLQLFNILQHKAVEDMVYELYETRYIVASEAFERIELRGFHYDAEGAANLNEAVVIPKIYELRDGIRQIVGLEQLNPRSTDQMAAIYYDRFGLKHGLKDKGKKKFARSTGKEVREEILLERALCNSGMMNDLRKLTDLHRAFAKIDKQRGTYIEGLIEKCDENGKLYCEFNLGGTATGRTSSKNPNFQNITREGVEGIPGIRTLFLPSDGCSIIQADYSQAELRACAVFSGEPGLTDIYRDSTRSLHKERAARFYGENYTKEEYVKSKNINFGVTYGQGAEYFAQLYHMDKDEAQQYIDDWWRMFPTLKAWVREVEQEAWSEGYVTSPFGHKRRFHLRTSENRGDIQRAAVNFLPQNTAAWFTISALCELVIDYDVPVITTVHDSIVADVPVGDVAAAAQLMKEVMEKQAKEQLDWNLPFTVDIAVGPTWADVQELDLEAIAA